MIDTIKCYLQTNNIGKLKNPVKSFANKLVYSVNGVHFHVFHEDGVPYLISFKTSLTKLAIGNNVRRSDHLTIKRAIVKLIRSSGLPITKFRISQLDVAVNVPYDDDIEELLKRFQYLPKYKKIDKWATSIRFQSKTGNNILRFYSKRHEVEENPKRHSGSFLIENLVRVEYSQKFDIKRGFNIDTINNLLKADSMIKLTDRLSSTYKRVHIEKYPRLENVNNDGDFINYLIAAGINSLGGLEQVKGQLKMLEADGKLRKKKTIDDRIATATKSTVNTVPFDVEVFEKAFYKELNRMHSINDDLSYH